MSSRRDEPRFFITGVLLAVSWIGTLYLYRQNQILRQKRTNNSDNDPVDSEDTDEDRKHDESHKSFVLDEIGVIQSPFPQRAGCPRQGTLAPHVASRLILHPHISIQVLEGITAYSHVWIIFCFHLNPRRKARSHGSQSLKFTANKVRPPRAKGIKVGVMATRAPHRPNPVGLSLASLEDVMAIRNSHDRKQACLILRGLDLVDGTPVYDIKPYVPWDRISDDTRLKVPSWVSADDELLTEVNWKTAAREQISEAKDYLAPLYAPTHIGVEEACSAIGEVIAQDPRAIMDGRGECSEEAFEFTFGAFRVSFLVDTRMRHAEVTSVVVDSGDLAASKGSYPHNLALRLAAEQEAKENGIKLRWANPVREGITTGLFDLQQGGTYEPRQDSYL